jgi:hypothetical protein
VSPVFLFAKILFLLSYILWKIAPISLKNQSHYQLEDKTASLQRAVFSQGEESKLGIKHNNDEDLIHDWVVPKIKRKYADREARPPDLQERGLILWERRTKK